MNPFPPCSHRDCIQRKIPFSPPKSHHIIDSTITLFPPHTTTQWGQHGGMGRRRRPHAPDWGAILHCRAHAARHRSTGEGRGSPFPCARKLRPEHCHLSRTAGRDARAHRSAGAGGDLTNSAPRRGGGGWPLCAKPPAGDLFACLPRDPGDAPGVALGQRMRRGVWSLDMARASGTQSAPCAVTHCHAAA
jgi:hypothetical protein